MQRPAHERVVLGPFILQERALHSLLLRGARNVDALHGQGIEPRVKHGRRERARGGDEVLHLLGLVADVAKVLRKLDGRAQVAARVAGDEVGHEVLVLPQALVDALILFAEGLEHLAARLAHELEDLGGDVLGRDLELAADVVGAELVEELVALVEHHVVKAQAGADEDLLDPGDLPEIPQQARQLLFVHLQVGAGLGRQALPVLAGADLELLFAGGEAEVGRRPAHVVDVSLEVGELGQQPRLLQDGLRAPGLHDAPLVERQRAERARAEAPAGAGDGELHLRKGGNAALRVVHGMPPARIGQVVDAVELLARQGHHGRFGHEHLFLVPLGERAAADGVLFLVLRAEGLAVGDLVLLARHEGGDLQRALGHLVRHVAGAGDARQRQPVAQAVRDANGLLFRHAVGEQVRAAVGQDRVADAVVPIVVVRKAPERGLHAADDDRDLAEGLVDAVAVDDRRAVRPQARPAARGVQVLGARALGRGIVVDHGVDVAGGDHEAVLGPAKARKVPRIVEVRLVEHAHAVAGILQHARDDGVSKGGMVHIRIPGHDDEIRLIPAAREHLLARHRQKLIGHFFLRSTLDAVKKLLPLLYNTRPRHASARKEGMRPARGLHPLLGFFGCPA